MKPKWAYGLTTVPARRESHLPHTLASLKRAGFPTPRLFVDQALDPRPWHGLGCDVVVRGFPGVRPWGNWFLGLCELYFREPNYDRFAIFQDDIIAVKNLRDFIDRSPFPEKGYLNLYTMPSNQRLAEEKGASGWFLSNQFGRSACGLVFSREGVHQLLQSEHLATRPMDVHKGHASIDGAVVTAMKKAGWQEWVHNPGLLQHTGLYTTIGPDHGPQKLSESFPGEDFDALSFIERALPPEG